MVVVGALEPARRNSAAEASPQSKSQFGQSEYQMPSYNLRSNNYDENTGIPSIPSMSSSTMASTYHHQLASERRNKRTKCKQLLKTHLKEVYTVIRSLYACCPCGKSVRKKYLQLTNNDDEEDLDEATPMHLEVQWYADKVGTILINIFFISIIFWFILIIHSTPEYDHTSSRGNGNNDGGNNDSGNNDSGNNDSGKNVYSEYDSNNGRDNGQNQQYDEFSLIDFERDAPLLLMVTMMEILFSGAACKTVASLFRTRQHAQKHPKHLKGTLEIHLERSSFDELWGITYRPSTDGLECLLIEDIIEKSPAARWNASHRFPGTFQFRRDESNLELACDLAIAGVNDVHADVGLMQIEFLKSLSITLYCRRLSFDQAFEESQHIETGAVSRSQHIETRVDNAQIVGQPMEQVVVIGTTTGSIIGSDGVNQSGVVTGIPIATQGGDRQKIHNETVIAGNVLSTNDTMNITNVTSNSDHFDIIERPAINKISIVSTEDEDLTTCYRWLICSTVFGWVTLIPLLLLNPHPERPRQKLFRNYLQKISSFILLPIWIGLYFIDTTEVYFHWRLYPPYVYFLVCHMFLASVIVFCGMKVGYVDEKLVFEQRAERQSEMESFETLNLEDVCIGTINMNQAMMNQADTTSKHEDSKEHTSRIGELTPATASERASDSTVVLGFRVKKIFLNTSGETLYSFYDRCGRPVNDRGCVLRNILETIEEAQGGYVGEFRLIRLDTIIDENRNKNTEDCCSTPKSTKSNGTTRPDYSVKAIKPSSRIWKEPITNTFHQDISGVLEEQRQRELSYINDGVPHQPYVVEQPTPLFLHELIVANPVAIVWIGIWLSIPLVIAQMVYPMRSARGRLAQVYVSSMFGSMIILQLIGFLVILNLRFEELPSTYLQAFALMLSYPCLMIWCCCLCWSNQYARADMNLVKRQRRVGVLEWLKVKLKEKKEEMQGNEGIKTGATLIVSGNRDQNQEYYSTNSMLSHISVSDIQKLEAGEILSDKTLDKFLEHQESHIRDYAYVNYV